MHLELILELLLVIINLFFDLLHVLAQTSSYVLHLSGGIAQFDDLGERRTDRTCLCDVLIRNFIVVDFVNELNYTPYLIIFVEKGTNQYVTNTLYIINVVYLLDKSWLVFAFLVNHGAF